MEFRTVKKGSLDSDKRHRYWYRTEGLGSKIEIFSRRKDGSVIK